MSPLSLAKPARARLCNYAVAPCSRRAESAEDDCIRKGKTGKGKRVERKGCCSTAHGGWGARPEMGKRVFVSGQQQARTGNPRSPMPWCCKVSAMVRVASPCRRRQIRLSRWHPHAKGARLFARRNRSGGTRRGDDASAHRSTDDIHPTARLGKTGTKPSPHPLRQQDKADSTLRAKAWRPNAAHTWRGQQCRVSQGASPTDKLT